MAGNDAYTVLLLHCDGTNGSKIIPDSSLSGVHGNASTAGTAQLSTSIKTFGTASLLLDGDSDYISFDDDADWNFGTDPFTIDCRIYLNTTSYSPGDGIGFAVQGPPSGNPQMGFGYGYVAGKLMWQCYNGGWVIQINADYTLEATAWHHFALVRVNTDNAATGWRMFVDGTALTLSLGQGAWNATMPDIGGTMNIGYGGSFSFLNGYIDELRISKGIARWTSNFTPPDAEYSEDTPAPGASRRIFLIT